MPIATKPATAADAPRPAPRKARIFLALGRGRLGKSFLLRTVSEVALGAGRPLMICDADPANRTLADGLSERGIRILQPHDSTEASRRQFLLDVLHVAEGGQQSYVIDLGGNDRTAVELAGPASLVDSPVPDDLWGIDGAIDPLRELPITVAYLLGGEPHDLSLLRNVVESALGGCDLLLVRNEGMLSRAAGAGDAPWQATTKHPLYQQALKAGARELVLPALPRHLAELLTATGAPFSDAFRGSAVVDGRPLGPLDRSLLGKFLRAFSEEVRRQGIADLLP